MFKALDYVNYHTLELNHRKDPEEKERFENYNATSLQEICCEALNDTAVISSDRQSLLIDAVRSLPLHMLVVLLRVAVEKQQNAAISNIISAWPYSTLCLREVLRPSGPRSSDIFQEEMNVDILVFRGLLRRLKSCRMSCLDLRGFKLNKGFSMLIVQLWPLISLPKRNINIEALTQTATQQAALHIKALKQKEAAAQFSALLATKISSLLARCRDFHISIPKGQKLVVKIDSLSFCLGDTLSQDYFIANCLRHITPLRLQVSQLFFRNSMATRLDGDLILSPTYVLDCHDTQFLDGISLRSMEEGNFKTFAPTLYKFQNLQAIELQDCNIYLQNGRTRSKTEDRKALCTFLGSFPLLCRLDLGYNYLQGCLGEVLEAVRRPLHFLSLRGCDLNVADLEALAGSKHAPELLELNLSKAIVNIGRDFVLGEVSVAPLAMVRMLKSFPKLTVLNLSQNTFPDQQIRELCDVLRNHLNNLKVLDMAAVVMTSQHQEDICLACASIPSFQKILITLVTSLVDELHNWNGIEDIAMRITNKMRKVGRWDVRLETVLFSRALFMDIVDDLQL